ncbi:MAG TPA: hypothetical protein VK087_03710 [Tissierellaceae bacterium]|nr:hypothetical protein [Tissierellaceae bacterium]
MFEDFMTIDMLTTFAGITTAVIVIVQFTKPLVKKRFGDHFVRLYSFLISLILIGVFTNDNFNIQGIILMIINSTMVTIASIGGYEMLVDPMAQKTRR